MTIKPTNFYYKRGESAMTEEAKRKAIKKYFQKFPTGAIWLILLGLILAMVGFKNGAGWVILGILLLALGILVIVLGVGGKPTDREMDQFLAEDLENAKKKSLLKLTMDESQIVGDPLVIKGIRVKTIASVKSAYKRGADSQIRYTPVDVTVLHMTQHQLVSYQAALDLFTGSLFSEATDEYFYKDIVSVATKTISMPATIAGRNYTLNAAETFQLTTSGGTSITVLLKDPLLISLMGKGGDIPITEAERAITVIRSMLREKKQA
jgi:hypothetical protein